MAQARDLFIPETPAELTSEWLTTALSDVTEGQGRVTGLQQQVLGEGEGFLGDLLRITPTYAPVAGEAKKAAISLPNSMIAKLPKLENRTMGEMLGAYERENMFYMTLADELPVATPRLYYAQLDRDADSEKQLEILRALDKLPNWMFGAVSKLGGWVAERKKRRYVLLIEDINDAAPGDQVAGADPSRAQQVVEALALLHAHFWQSQTLDGHFWLLPLDVDARMKHGLSKKSLPLFEKVFGDVLDAGLRSYVDEVMARGPDTLYELCKSPQTLLHGDMRLDNVFFRESEVVFFDWQLVRRGPAAYDLAYLLSGGLAPDYGSADGLLDTYHAALVAAGVSGYSRDQLQRDYQLALLVVLSPLLAIDQIELGEDRGMVMMRLWIERLLGRLQAL